MYKLVNMTSGEVYGTYHNILTALDDLEFLSNISLDYFEVQEV